MLIVRMYLPSQFHKEFPYGMRENKRVWRHSSWSSIYWDSISSKYSNL